MSSQDRAAALSAGAAPRIEYRHVSPGEPLPRDLLAAVVFGRDAPGAHDARTIRVGLEPLGGPAPAELWHASGPVRTGEEGPIRFSSDEAHLVGCLEMDERACGGLAGAARAAYETIRRFQERSTHAHLLRMWNYFDAINHGADDAERYRQFCLGRAQGLGSGIADYPAASAIGRRDGEPTLQIYWLAGRTAGRALENPRQLAAYRYPRQYGPAAPSFSRAMLLPGPLLLISGTASIIGHASHHPENLAAQLDETLANLASVRQRAAMLSPGLRNRFGPETLLKVYLRRPELAVELRTQLAERLPRKASWLLLQADICREELLLEIDCAHGAG